MSDKLKKRFPAYEGEEPYLVFCFAEADERRAAKLLERMAARGTRLWYAVGRPRDRAERAERERRMKGARLCVLVLSAAAREDLELKNAALYCQASGVPLLCVDADEGSSALAFGLTEQTQHLRARAYRNAAELEEALVRSEGFSQELIGEEPIIPSPPYLKATILLAAASVLLAALVLLGGRMFGWFAPPESVYHDSVTLTDDALRDAVRAAVGGGEITEENLASVRTLRLRELPENSEELRLLGALERVEIPQSEAADALGLLEAGYTVVLYGGEGA